MRIFSCVVFCVVELVLSWTSSFSAAKNSGRQRPLSGSSGTSFDRFFKTDSMSLKRKKTKRKIKGDPHGAEWSSALCQRHIQALRQRSEGGAQNPDHHNLNKNKKTTSKK
jgi:hypothetical protein